MALIKNKIIENYGIEAGYWKVGMFTVDTNAREVSFSFNLYVSKDKAREVNKFIYSINVSDLMCVEDKTLYNKYFAKATYKDWQTACYMYAKDNIDYFKDAIDDLEV